MADWRNGTGAVPEEDRLLPLNWTDAQQAFALSLSPQLCATPNVNDLFATAAGTTDGSWAAVGNPTLPGGGGGVIALGAFTEAAWIFPTGQANSTGGYIKSPKHGMWYASARSCVSIFCANAGSRQFLCGLSNTVLIAGIAYVPSLSTTNWVLCIDNGGTMGASVVTSEPRRQSSTTDRDFAVFYDGVSIKAYTGDLLGGVPMNQIGELTACEALPDAVGYVSIAGVRIVTEAGGPTAFYDKIMTLGTQNR